MVSDVQMNASTLEVMRTPERRTSSSGAPASAASPPEAAKQKLMRRPSLRTTALDHTQDDPQPQSHVRRGSGASSSSDSLVVRFICVDDLPSSNPCRDL